MAHYSTKRYKNRRRIGWASRMPLADSDILAGVVEAVRSRFFSATVVLCLPDREVLACEISESGRRLRISGRRGSVLVPASVAWKLIDACRKADRANPA